jgi:hypothetical protein
MKMKLTVQEQKFLFKSMDVGRVNQLLNADDFNAILLIQEFLNDRYGYNLKEDGAWGPNTEHALYAVSTTGKKRTPPRTYNGNNSNGQKMGVITIPNRPSWTSTLPTTGAAAMNKFYGKPGTNLVRLTFPYKMYYAGKRCRTTRVNKRCLPWFMNIFNEIKKEYDQETIDRLKLSDYSGLVNIRPIRGGTRPSSHSWGAVIDMNATDNRMHQNHHTARFAKAEYQRFWDIVYAAGGVSLGLTSDFDFMHFGFYR